MELTRRIIIASAALAALLLGAEADAIAGDPEAVNEAPAPGPAPAIAIWNQETRSAEADGLRYSLEEDGVLAITVEEGAWRAVDLEVRCELAQGSPMARLYVPPVLVSEKRVADRLITGETLRVRLDIDEGEAASSRPMAGAYDTLRVTVSAPGASETPLALLQVPRG